MPILIAMLIAVSVVIPASAQVHQATPLNVLLARLGATHGSHESSMTAHDMAAMAEAMKWEGSAVTIDAMPAANAAMMANASPNATSKTFNITARQFQYSVTPFPFVVNQGDDVTLNISVPSNDGSGVGHGFFLESYMTDGLSIAHGDSVTFHFVASTPGTFTYFCTVVCGSGHPNMNGIMTVAQAQADPPAVTSVSPASGPAAGGNGITINGGNFQTNAAVSFGGSAATSVVVSSATTISATVPAHAAGRVTLSVTNPDGQSASFDGYTYVAAPSITSISPTSAPVTGGTQMTITGSGFAAGATVNIGGAAAAATVVSSTTITATVPAAAPTEQLAVPRDVVVTNPDGQIATLAGAFTYTLPALAVSSIDPSGASPAGGVVVTIVGNGFTTAVATSVTFGGVAATNVTVLSATAIRVTAPPHAAGVVDVKVTVGANSVTVANGFTYGTAPSRRRSARH